jgi:hypothetical protein
MDATVFPEGRGVWHVNATRTMRSLGEIVQHEDQTFWVLPDDGSDLQGISGGPHASAEDAMAAITIPRYVLCWPQALAAIDVKPRRTLRRPCRWSGDSPPAYPSRETGDQEQCSRRRYRI